MPRIPSTSATAAACDKGQDHDKEVIAIPFFRRFLILVPAAGLGLILSLILGLIFILPDTGLGAVL